VACQKVREVFWQRHGTEIMMDETIPIRILVVDDHPVVRAGIETLVFGHKDVSVVAQASNGREAIQVFRARHPDVTLMDLQMPEMNRLDALMAIRNESPEARIIMLTTYAGDAQVMRDQSRS
jgi:DNA-binding NarL/FixJ family response regulator